MTGQEAATSVVLLAAATTATGYLLRTTWRALRWVVRMVRLSIRAFEDIVGSPERPGVIDRLAVLEEKAASMHYELHPNGGRSMRDSVDRLEMALGTAQPGGAG